MRLGLYMHHVSHASMHLIRTDQKGKGCNRWRSSFIGVQLEEGLVWGLMEIICYICIMSSVISLLRSLMYT